MVVKNLEFFDKNGYNLNLNWNEQKQIWEGNIFFPRVSVGLYENTSIYIIEYCGYDNDYTDDVYSYPTGSGNIVFSWDLANSFVDEFFMFMFDENYEIKDTSALIHTPYDGPTCETLIINKFDKYIVPLFNSEEYFGLEQDDLLEVHVAFRADEKSSETTYKRTLIISYENGNVKYEIARITFFAETIEEDERLKAWSENLGYNLKPEDSMIFKNSDIHECMPDYELLNEKRKELMLEGSNIYPYVGGYKSIINAIKFFGYDNLNIVEYWRNVNKYDQEFGKIYRTYVYSLKNKKTLSTKRSQISLNTKNFQKLNTISLAYNINHPEKIDGKKYDDYGLPNVIEDFDKDKRDDFILTIEEALIKLFALKKKLNDEFMPGSTKITDVIGEGNYFGINLIGNNPQISTINYVESNGYVDFSVFPDKHCYITENEDFSKYIAEKLEINTEQRIGDVRNKTIEELDDSYNDGENNTKKLSDIIKDLMVKENDTVCECYEEYYNIITGNNKEHLVREIPEAKNVYKDVIADDIINNKYDKNELFPDISVCAKVILKGEFDESVDDTSIIEWKITHTEKEWSVVYYGDVKTYGNLFAQLPYLGNYNVEVTVWGLYNHCRKKCINDAIIVEPYNIDIRGFYYDARPLPNKLEYDLMIPDEYKDKYYLWYKYEGDVKKGIITTKRNPMEMTLSDIIGEYIIDGENLDEYIGLENIRENAVDREKWVYIKNTENDGDNVLKLYWISEDGIDEGTDKFIFDTDLDIEYFEEKIKDSNKYYIWYKYEGDVKKGIVTTKRNPMEITLSDIIGEYIIDGLFLDEYIGLENIREDAVDREKWDSILNTENDGDNVLKLYWISEDGDEGIDEFIFDKELDDFKFEENLDIEKEDKYFEEKYRYYLWYKYEGDVKKGIVTYNKNPIKMTLSDIFGEYIIDGEGLDEYIGLENIRDAIEKEKWISIINTESDNNKVLKLSWISNDSYGVDEYIFDGELDDVPFDENDSYVPEWNKDALYNVIKNNVDKMYSWALQEHLNENDVNSTMRNYRPDGSVNFEGPYYKFDVETILYKASKGYKEYDHLNEEIINLEHGKYYKYVRYINNIVDIKPLTWVLLGLDYTKITGRIVNDTYPKWTLIMTGNELDLDKDLRKDKIITTHYGLYFTYLFEHEGLYKIKLEILDINGNLYEIEKPIIIVDKDANYEMYHTLNDEYNKYLEEKMKKN